MNEYAWVTILAPFIVPVVSFVKNQAWPTWAKQGLCGVGSFGVALLAGVATGEFTLDALDVDKVLGFTGWAFLAAQAVYQAYFKTAVGAKLGGAAIDAKLTKALWG